MRGERAATAFLQLGISCFRVRFPFSVPQQDIDSGVPPQYGAVVFSDNVTQHVADRVGDAVTDALPGLSPLNASAAWQAVQQQAGAGAPLAWSLLQASPEGRWALGRSTYRLPFQFVACACQCPRAVLCKSYLPVESPDDSADM